MGHSLRSDLNFNAFRNSLKKDDVVLTKAADIVSRPENKPGYGYEVSLELGKERWNKSLGWAYVIKVGDYAVKVGMTESTLSSRFSSYQAGTPENRKKGTCSVTNYSVSQAIRQHLKDGIPIELYVLRAAPVEIEKTILNETVKIPSKTAFAYENALINRYVELNGSKPSLCRNNSNC